MAKEKLCGIYCIENTVNGERYIGQSVNMYTRWKQHKNDLNNGTHCNEHLQNAWDCYGEKSFKFYILEECALELLDEREIYYIQLFNVEDREYGYNIESGGNVNKVVPLETRQKMSAAKSDCFGEKNSFYGRHHTEEAKQADREAHRRANLSDETWQKMCSAQKARLSVPENNPMFGRRHTEETKLLMSQNTIKRFGADNFNSKSVYCIELDQSFESMVAAFTYVGISRATLQLHLKGKKESAGKHPITGEPLHWINLKTNNNTQQND